MSTIGSRTIMPLPKVTTRAPGSSFVSTTKPGTSRVWSAPISRMAAQTWSGRALVKIFLRIEAILFSHNNQLLRLDARRRRYNSHQPVIDDQLAVMLAVVLQEGH